MLPAGQEGRLYAADGIAEAARLAGVRVQTIKLATFVVSGGTAALGGILLIAVDTDAWSRRRTG